MAAKKKVGELIKEARTNAGLSQTALAEKVEGVSASDIGKAERGEKELSQAALKQIAKATGVTQKSLLEAAGYATSSSSSKKTSSSSAKKTESSSAKKKTESSSAKKTESSSAKKKTSSSSSSKKTSSSSGTSVKVTAAEKKLLELYRAADADTKKAAVSLLKGETPETSAILSSLLGGAMEMLGNLGKKDK